MVHGRHRIERQSVIHRQRDAFEREQPLLRHHAPGRGEASGRPAGGEHAVARDGDQEWIPPQRLPDGARRSRLAEHRGNLAVRRRAPGRKRAHLLVDGALERREQRKIERQRAQVLRLAGETTLEEPRGVSHERGRLSAVLLAELRPQRAGRKLGHLDPGEAALVPPQPHGSCAGLEEHPRSVAGRRAGR